MVSVCRPSTKKWGAWASSLPETSRRLTQEHTRYVSVATRLTQRWPQGSRPLSARWRSVGHLEAAYWWVAYRTPAISPWIFLGAHLVWVVRRLMKWSSAKPPSTLALRSRRFESGGPQQLSDWPWMV